MDRAPSRFQRSQELIRKPVIEGSFAWRHNILAHPFQALKYYNKLAEEIQR